MPTVPIALPVSGAGIPPEGPLVHFTNSRRDVSNRMPIVSLSIPLIVLDRTHVEDADHARTPETPCIYIVLSCQDIRCCDRVHLVRLLLIPSPST